jgi:hypothetical protein
MAYYRLVISSAFAETKAFWNVHQIWKYAAVPISGVLLRLLIKGLSPTMGWEGFLEEAALFCIFGFIVSWMGTFLINLIRVPPLVYREQEARIADLTEDSRKLYDETHSKVPAEEEHRRNITAENTKKLSKVQKEMLRHILNYGPLKPTMLLERFAGADVQEAMVSGSLYLTKLIENVGHEWEIKQEFRSALDFVLRSEGL